MEGIHPTIQELERKLQSVRREVRNLTVMGMDPSQPADQLAVIKQLEISARAEQCSRKDGVGLLKSERTAGQKRNQNIRHLTPYHNAKKSTKPITTAPDSTAITTR